ncbi:MAG TPA: hypothetical protein VII71_00680 [Verrucomicrobiae bacterium]
MSPAHFFATLAVMQKFLFGLCLVLASLIPSASGAEIKISFNDFTAGATPTNFHDVLVGGGKAGEWKIVMDEVPSAFSALTPQAPIFNRQAVLAQTSQDPTDERFPLFVYDGEIFQNFKLTTRFKIVSGVSEQMAGIVFRFQNASNFYVLRASALGQNFRFYKVVDGLRSDPIGPATEISTNAWHTLAVQCQGNQIACWLDDKLAMPPLGDNTFAIGKIGFWTKSDAVSYFSDATIDYTPRVPVAQALVRSLLEQQPRILGLRIYTLDAQGRPHIIASKDETEIGQPGEDAEKIAITNGTVSFGKSAGVVAVTLPLRDRNGDPVAAVRLRLKSFVGETQDNAVTRATLLIRRMEGQIGSTDQLMQ